MRPAAWWGLCAALSLAGAAEGRPNSAERVAAREISPDLLRAHTRFLASDELMGRGPGTQGDRLTQGYIASQFELLGLKPAGKDGSFLQPFELVGITGFPPALAARSGSKKLELKYHEDFIAVAGGQQAQSRLAEAELVFVGYGIVAPEYHWDDFKGVELSGKVLVFLNNDPEQPPLFGGKARLWYGRWDYKFEMAGKQGAAGAIILHTTPSAGYPWQVVQTSWSGEQFELPARGTNGLQMRAWTTEEATRRLFSLGGHDLDQLREQAQSRSFRPVPLGVTVSAAFTNALKRTKTANVLGVLPGADPNLANEWVVITAHHDHLGIKAGARPMEDHIYNGAIDNASGVAALLALARAARSLPQAPRRSILFAAVAAEEQGLLGSEYLVENPPVPLGAMAANINVDGLNVWGKTKDVTVIGLGKSSLDTLIRKLAANQNRVVKADQLSDRGFFYRSDQFNFAKRGVPATYFGSGLDFVGRNEGWGRRKREEWEAFRYHQPSDEFDEDWDWTGAVEDVQLYFHLAVAVANAPTMPSWNAGDEFEAPRRAALEARKNQTRAAGK